MKAATGSGRRDPQARAHPLAPSEEKSFGWQLLLLLALGLMFWLLRLGEIFLPRLGPLDPGILAFGLGVVCVVVAAIFIRLQARVAALEKLFAELEAKRAGEPQNP